MTSPPAVAATFGPSFGGSRRGGVLRLTLNRPKERNALSRDPPRGACSRRSSRPAADEAVRAVVIAAEGPGFWPAMICGRSRPIMAMPMADAVQRRALRCLHPADDRHPALAPGLHRRSRRAPPLPPAASWSRAATWRSLRAPRVSASTASIRAVLLDPDGRGRAQPAAQARLELLTTGRLMGAEEAHECRVSSTG